MRGSREKHSGTRTASDKDSFGLSVKFDSFSLSVKSDNVNDIRTGHVQGTHEEEVQLICDVLVLYTSLHACVPKTSNFTHPSFSFILSVKFDTLSMTYERAMCRARMRRRCS